MSFRIGDMIEQYVEADKRDFAALKKQEKEMLKTMRGAALEQVYSGREPLTQYLDLQARLTNLSPGNALLIFSQRPDASDMRTFDAWKAVGRDIKTGETGSLILEPTEYPDKENPGRMVSDFQVTRRFDIEQTHGLPLTPAPLPPFDPVERFRNLVKGAPFRFAPSEANMGLAAYYNARERVIFYTEGYDPQTSLGAMATAIAEAMVKPGARNAVTKFTANCAAYIACRRIGMENMDCFELNPVTLTLDALNMADSIAAQLQVRLDRPPAQHNREQAQGQGR